VLSELSGMQNENARPELLLPGFLNFSDSRAKKYPLINLKPGFHLFPGGTDDREL
jgi:hypothetical protein